LQHPIKLLAVRFEDVALLDTLVIANRFEVNTLDMVATFPIRLMIFPVVELSVGKLALLELRMVESVDCPC
jgi:hypothetical protein